MGDGRRRNITKSLSRNTSHGHERQLWYQRLGWGVAAALVVQGCGEADQVTVEPGDGAGGGQLEDNLSPTESDPGEVLLPAAPEVDVLLPQGVDELAPVPALSPAIEALRLEPASSEIRLLLPDAARQAYRAWAKFEGVTDEVEVTEDAVFSVTDNWLVGEFPGFENVFETNAADPRGGLVTVQADVLSPDGSIVSAETDLRVVLQSSLTDPRPEVELPAGIETLFEQAKMAAPQPQRMAPELIYPTAGTLLPPNLRRLEIHFEPGDGEWFEMTFKSEHLEQSYHLGCGELLNDGCVFELDQAGYRTLAESARGKTVEISLVATDSLGSFAASTESSLLFSSTDVLGAVYYWTVSSPTAIMRFDFGSLQEKPEVFLTPGQSGLPNTCVGCHTLSRDGSKLVASLGGQNDGLQVLVNDLTRSPDDPNFLAKAGDQVNRIQFASFSPDATRFVGVYGDTEAPARNTLWFHDGDTGDRIAEESFQLDFEPDHPDWSPDGSMIAMTHVGIHRTSQRPANSGVDLIRQQQDGAWSTPEVVVPIATDLNRFNPSFVPDSSLLVFSESTCPTGQPMSHRCDADDDPTSTTWAVLPEVGADAVHLARAAAGGKLDQTTELHDTFPRSSPFVGSYAEQEIFWVTVSSRRAAGFRNPGQGQQLLWMFALDRRAVLAGEDGSFPAFFLPFQALDTSNHIAQWAERVVSDDPPPQAPPPLAPEPPPAPQEPPVVK